jgi:hypothetical protein
VAKWIGLRGIGLGAEAQALEQAHEPARQPPRDAPDLRVRRSERAEAQWHPFGCARNSPAPCAPNRSAEAALAGRPRLDMAPTVYGAA